MEFTPQISDADLTDLDHRLGRTRWPSSPTDPAQGPSPERLRHLVDHWRTAYDWDRYRARLTSLPQVRVEVDGLPLHAIHVRSERADATPLLMGHGWPSTCFEFDRVVPLLARDFHVVCPSLPGYGFSGVPSEPGWGAARTADAFVGLMSALGYDRFLAHGGDWGAIVTTELALRRPERLLGLHLTMPLARPTDEEVAAASDAERAGLEREQRYRKDGFGYAMIQMTRSQTIGHALDDSPVGLLAWIVEKLDAWSGTGADGGSLLDDEAVLDVVSTYWLTRTATSSARLYAEALRGDHDRPVSGVPTGCSVFADEIIRPPRAAVERRYGPLVSWHELERGGHFPAAELPEVLAAEVREFAQAVAP